MTTPSDPRHAAPPARPDPTPLPDRHGPAAETGLPGSEANKPGGGPQTAGGAPGAPRRKAQPDDGWVETGTSYGGLRTKVPAEPENPGQSPRADDSPGPTAHD